MQQSGDEEEALDFLLGPFCSVHRATTSLHITIGPHDRLYVPVYFNDCWFIIWPETGREILSRSVGGLFLFPRALFSDLKGIARTNWTAELPTLAQTNFRRGITYAFFEQTLAFNYFLLATVYVRDSFEVEMDFSSILNMNGYEKHCQTHSSKSELYTLKFIP